MTADRRDRPSTPVPSGDRQNGGTGRPHRLDSIGGPPVTPLTRSDPIMADKQLRDQHDDTVNRNRQQRLDTAAQAQALADQRNRNNGRG